MPVAHAPAPAGDRKERDVERVGDARTKVTIRNTFAGHGFGKLLLPLALRAARKDAPAFAGRIKAAIEAR